LLHAACGLLGKEGIHLVGGKDIENNWVPNHFYYDLIEGIMTKAN
jgi:hypothetical protein